MAVIKDLGAVTAYASAVEGGYTGTKEEFATLMASYATVAEEAAESAESASQSAESASSSATTATQKASEASTSATQASASATSASQSATTASTKASEASASASTAGTKASEASASATTASSKASEASQSATSAQTAQGLAESARDDAIDAKTDAETARDMAQQYAESIDPEKIFSAYATDTASGSVASFADGADDIPMKSVKVALEPVQDLHGYDNPWPAGGKGNLFQTTATSKTENGVTWTVNTDGSVTASGVATDYSGIELGEAIVDGITETVTVHADVSSTNRNVIIAYIQLYDANNTRLANLNNLGFDSTYTLDLSQYSGAYKIIVALKRNANATVSGTYHVQVVKGTTVGDWYPYSNICPISGWTGAQVSHSGADTSAPTTYPITFPTEAGTVYGGTLDVTNGTLTVDRAFIASYNGETLPSEWISDRDKYVAGTTPTTGAQVVYKLATPITYTMTGTEIKSLLGDNNIWADAGDTTVTYRADTAKYIDKKIAEVVNALS